MSSAIFFGGGGQEGEGVVYLVGSGTDDDGTAIRVRAKTNRLAPAGIGGECVFTGLFMVFETSKAVGLHVTPYVDDVALEVQVVALTPAVSGVRQRFVIELGLSIPSKNDLGIEVGRFFPRGVWAQVMLETVTAPEDLTIEGVEVEYEAVRESREAS